MMNLAFQIENDKPLSKEDFEPFKIVSLRDMLKFYADDFIKLCSDLTRISSTIESLASRANKPLKIHPFPEEMRDLYKIVPDGLRQIGLTVSPQHAEALFAYMNTDETLEANTLKSLADALKWSFIYELQGRLIMMIPSKRANLYNHKATFLGREMITEFPDLNEDATEAGNCFALGRYTACVFHLMRIMERCVQKLGNTLGLLEEITYDKEWQKIINDIRGQLKKLHPKEKDPQRIRHEAMLGHLETVKIAWRNPTMHPKATYTEEEAQALMDAVKVFVQDFSPHASSRQEVS